VKRSTAAVLFAALVATELAAKLLVPAAILALAHGLGDGAVLAAVSANGLVLLRGLASGRAVEQEERYLWRELVSAVRRHSVLSLARHREERDVVQLFEAIHATARYGSSTLPRLVADGLGLLIVTVVVVWWFGSRWILFALPVLAAAALATRGLQRSVRTSEQRLLDSFGELARDLRALIAAAAELRAHHSEAAHADRVVGAARTMAAVHRRLDTASSLTTLLPLAMGVLAASVSLRIWLAEILHGSAIHAFADLGVVGAAGLAFALGVVRGLEGIARSAPYRTALRNFVRPMGDEIGGSPRDSSMNDGSGWRAEVELECVSVVYSGADDATPAPVSYRWPPGRGLALRGDNGAGKSTLAHVILGLLPATRGEVRVGGVAMSAPSLRRLGVVAYVPQDPFVDEARSVGWHMRLAVGSRPTEKELLSGLEDVGLLSLLKARSRDPLDVRVGRLSGREQRRMHLARVFVRRGGMRPSLVVLDEPEAGLDEAGRIHVADLLANVSSDQRVLLIAHDPRIIPPSFDVLSCHRGPVES
jgi:ABC-type transport system involved in cytochrome bd biosynthesis fused ATPase/permease subunit